MMYSIIQWYILVQLQLCFYVISSKNIPTTLLLSQVFSRNGTKESQQEKSSKLKKKNRANISLAAGEKCKIAAAFELFQEQEKGTNESFKNKKGWVYRRVIKGIARPEAG